MRCNSNVNIKNNMDNHNNVDNNDSSSGFIHWSIVLGYNYCNGSVLNIPINIVNEILKIINGTILMKVFENQIILQYCVIVKLQLNIIL